MKKKIAIIGNMNNSSYPLLRYLLDAGYSTDLILLESEFLHFHPENDTFESVNISSKNSKLSVFPSAFWEVDTKYVKDLLLPYDIIIGCGPAPAYLSRINRILDIFIPYGSDIYYLPFKSVNLKTKCLKTIKEQFFKYHQRRGIRMAAKVMMDYTNDSYESLFASLGINHKRIFTNSPYLYLPEFNPENVEKLTKFSKYYPIFSELRKENDILIFHHSRHEWNSDGKVDVERNSHTKGNDKLIRAFASFLRKTKANAHLVLFEYGTCVEMSKHLVKDLNIEDQVTWLPIMPRKEIMLGISLCDIGVGELDSSYYSYGCIYEFLAMAKPVIHYRDDKLYTKYYSDMYPMFSARSEEEVEKYLYAYINDPDNFRKTGFKAHKWFVENAIEEPLREVIKIIE